MVRKIGEGRVCPSQDLEGDSENVQIGYFW